MVVSFLTVGVVTGLILLTTTGVRAAENERIPLDPPPADLARASVELRVTVASAAIARLESMVVCVFMARLRVIRWKRASIALRSLVVRMTISQCDISHADDDSGMRYHSMGDHMDDDCGCAPDLAKDCWDRHLVSHSLCHAQKSIRAARRRP